VVHAALQKWRMQPLLQSEATQKKRPYVAAEAAPDKLLKKPLRCHPQPAAAGEGSASC
jgi:hypothetical protein